METKTNLDMKADTETVTVVKTITDTMTIQEARDKVTQFNKQLSDLENNLGLIQTQIDNVTSLRDRISSVLPVSDPKEIKIEDVKEDKD